MFDIVGSIVLYNTNIEMLQKAVDSFFKTALNVKLVLVDNSESDTVSSYFLDNRIHYIFTQKNCGYGTAHNLAITKYFNDSKYHLVFNPDVVFGENTLEKLYNFLENNEDIGHAMPKVLNPDGSIQYLCKLLPTPYDLFIRRFLPNSRSTAKRTEKYELWFSGYKKVMDVPYLSGSFMFLRTNALKEVGLFDERYFMYPEDIDLTRRIHTKYRTVFFPNVSVIHDHQKASYKSKKIMLIHIWNIIKYFNKWGWFFDSNRREINKRVLKRLKYKSRD